MLTKVPEVAHAHCNVVRITAYIDHLGDLVNNLDFTIGDNRLAQVEHYRKILADIEASLDEAPRANNTRECHSSMRTTLG